MMGRGWITGNDIRSKPTTKEYRDNYERIFKKWDEYQESCEKKRRHTKDSPDGIPCSCGKPVDDPIHVPRIEI